MVGSFGVSSAFLPLTSPTPTSLLRRQPQSLTPSRIGGQPSCRSGRQQRLGARNTNYYPLRRISGVIDERCAANASLGTSPNRADAKDRWTGAGVGLKDE